MANGVPQPLLDLLASLKVEGLPTRAAPGDRITMRIVPDLAPKDGQLPAVLTALMQGDVLAQVDIDPGPLVGWLIDALEVAGWSKAVEFGQSVTAPAADLVRESPVLRALPHLIPGALAGELVSSPNVKGIIGRLKLIRDETAGTVESLTGTLRKPGITGEVSQPTVEVRVRDEIGAELSPGNGYFKSTSFVPELVFPPVAVTSASAQPTVRRTISVHVAMKFTPPLATQPIDVEQTLGPFPIDIATVETPVVALLARHALTPGAASGHVFVGVPASSSLNGVGDVIQALGPLRTVTRNVVAVLGALGIPVPGGLAEALRALDFVPGVTSDFRFGKGDLLGLWALFADWQHIMSAAMVFGPSSRRAFFGTFVGHSMHGFSLRPDVLGVGFIPDLRNPSIAAAATVGTATDDFPLPAGNYDNRITSVNFPAS